MPSNLSLSVLFLLVLGFHTLPAAEALDPSSPAEFPPPPTIIERGPNHRVWQTVTREETPDGTERFSTNSYTELSPSIYYFEDNKWNESQEEIVVQDGVAVALKGQGKCQSLD